MSDIQNGPKSGPKCPECKVEGIQHFVSKNSVETSKAGTPWFIVIHCDQCGHVHQVITKHNFSHAQSKFVLPDF